MKEKARILKEFEIFEDLSDEQLEAVSEVLWEEVVPEGTTIIRESEKGDTLYLLLEGSVEISRSITLRLSRYDYGRREKLLSRMTAKERVFFGETGLLEDSDRMATVVATTRCRLLALDRAGFEMLSERDPVLGYKVMRRICKTLVERLRGANEDILKLVTALSIALNR
jgi:CRP-like cAMP-binding protein